MPNELTITNLECVLTKLRLEPGDVLLVKCSVPVRDSQRAKIAETVKESFGIPAVVLPSDLTFQAVLNIPPELIERAHRLGDKRHREFIETMKKCGITDVRTLPTDAGHNAIPQGVQAGSEACESTEASDA